MSPSTRLPIPMPRSSAEDPYSAPMSPPAPPAGALSLLIQARTCLHDSEQAGRPNERYVAAHLAALRGATAVVSARSRWGTGERPTSVWRLLTTTAPELREWAEFFAAGSERRAAAESGVPVPDVDADALLFHAGEFLEIVGRSLLEAPR